MSSGGPSWKDTLLMLPVVGGEGVGLKRSGFARGRLERRWGAGLINFCVEKVDLDSWGIPESSRNWRLVKSSPRTS